jgi:hypothetical protein
MKNMQMLLIRLLSTLSVIYMASVFYRVCHCDAETGITLFVWCSEEIVDVGEQVACLGVLL